VQAIARATGQKVGKRQVEDLAALAAVDFESTAEESVRPAEVGLWDHTIPEEELGSVVEMAPSDG